MPARIFLLPGSRRSEDAGLKPESTKHLSALYTELTERTGKIINMSLNSSSMPPFEEVDALITMFEEFTYRVRRLEIDCLMENSGIDPITGLRNEAVLESDLVRELDRLARQGRSFSVALVRIDGLDAIKQAGRTDEALQLVSRMIKRSLRSFDDAYRISDDDFLLSLKQADMSGGVRALERLREELRRYERSESDFAGLSLSSCVAVPTPGDNVSDLVENLREDLDSSEITEGGAVLEYFEMSPLQRFIKDEKG